ncbi:MAG: DUF4258 domain-containing protein [Candidatus Omnitrophica bacterium]|nr:DUF4258 domain-containing protein [Candidatus Omnitrophota bacterium]
MKRPLAWTEHARFRMHLRRIPKAVVEKVLAAPLVEATDTLTGNRVAVGEVFYAGKIRFIVVVFEEMAEGIRVVTVHPIRASQYRMRLHSGRWKRK